MKTESIVLAAYGSPGVLGAQHLLDMGFEASSIGLLTHAEDERNAPLISFASEKGIDICQASVKDPASLIWLTKRRPDALFSLHYRDKIPGEMLAVPKFGGVNLHPSLLPRHRGCFSIPWAIIEGDSITGFSYHVMTENFDEGTLLLQREVPIKNTDTAYSLFHQLIEEGMAAFSEVVELALSGAKGVQQEGQGCYHSRAVPFDGVIDPSWSREQVDRFIRAMHFPPHKPAMLQINGKLEPVDSLKAYDALVSCI